jgi:hypothetical protein
MQFPETEGDEQLKKWPLPIFNPGKDDDFFTLKPCIW